HLPQARPNRNIEHPIDIQDFSEPEYLLRAGSRPWADDFFSRSVTQCTCLSYGHDSFIDWSCDRDIWICARSKSIRSAIVRSFYFGAFAPKSKMARFCAPNMMAYSPADKSVCGSKMVFPSSVEVVVGTTLFALA